MVRSKFPGKPSKLVNRKLVKSSKYCVLQDNEASKAAENISYGLAVFNETFGDHDQVLTAFHGFSPHEVNKARETADKQQEKVELEYQTSGLMFPPDDAFPVKLDPPTAQVLSIVEANLSLIGPVGSHTTRAQCQNLSPESTSVDFSKPISPSKFFSPFKVNHKKRVANRLLQKAKKATLEVNTGNNRLLLNLPLDKDGANSLSRTFKLPSRSVRSCRVIKPNKRFLDSAETEDNEPGSTSSSCQSTHTRVIELKKPRLILDEENNFLVPKSNGSKSSPSDRLFMKVDSESYRIDSDSKEHVKLGELNVFGAPTTRPKRRASQSSSEGSPKKDVSLSLHCASLASTPTQLVGIVSPSKSKVILRESKLSVTATSGNPQEGFFSMKPKKGAVLKSPGTPTECGVCSAVCSSRLTKQALKFGLICCDSCRKFVAKMILRAKSSENSVPCEKGQGNCAVISASHIGDNFSVKINRCCACWLLVCVQRLLKMPEKIRDSLIRMLPANMQGMTVLFPAVTVPINPSNKCNHRRKGSNIKIPKENSKTSSKTNAASSKVSKKLPPSSSNKRLPQTPISRIRRKAALVSLANNLRRVREKTFATVSSSGPINKKCVVEDSPDKPPKIKKLSHSRKSDLLFRNSDKPVVKGSSKTLAKNKDGQIRQKSSVKGPRVKHVCRSASIVLGQPLATFPLKPSVSGIADEISELKGSPIMSIIAADPAEKIDRLKADVSVKEKRQKGHSQRAPVKSVKKDENERRSMSPPAQGQTLTSTISGIDIKPAAKAVSEASSLQVSAPVRKITRPVTSFQHNVFQRGQRRTLQDLGVYNTQLDNMPELLSLDFWESYDPDEVCYTGFGLIGFDPFCVKPVCFLCGSAGKKKLIHCASCCEPYHQFCVEIGNFGGLGLTASSCQTDSDDWRVDWVCPRCTVCHGCGHSTGHQLTRCQRCHHSYHLDCLGTSGLRKSASDRLWICSSCLRCKSCNSADVTKFVGNLPFCKVCFKLRQKGNFCPLCQGCYTDDDYQSKMMECAECKSWVHAKCEGLSDEKYQVLSYLPESVEFICRLCCVFPPAPWWIAVEAELQAGYSNIVKAITKNRKACAMLKWSPRKVCDCIHKSVQSSAKISSPSVDQGKRRLSFDSKPQDQLENEVSSFRLSKCKSLSATLSPNTPGLPKEGEDSSVFEFDDDIDAGENLPITRYIHAKGKTKAGNEHLEYANLHLDCGSDTVERPEKSAQFSPHAGSQSDSGVGSTDDELKTCYATEEEEIDESKIVIDVSGNCTCGGLKLKDSQPTLLTVKKKVHSNEYSSIIEFHQDMDQLINEADSQEVKELYHQTLQEVFPWFDPKYDKVSRNSFPLSPCKPHHGSLLQYQSHNSSPEKPCLNSSSSLEMLKRLLPRDIKEMDDIYFYSGISLEDARVCGFCKLLGDSEAYNEGRLVYCGQNEWVHVNCALWSAEVFEEIDGALQNVSNALSRGRMIRCAECGKKGASVGCCAKKCEETLHFPCARKVGFVFMEDKNVYCPLHNKDAPGKPLTKPADFDIYRPVFVELDRRKKKCIESKHARLMIGSLFVENLGSISPGLSDQGSSIVPTQFCCTRLFWSTKEPWRIVRYTIRTTVRLPAPDPLPDLGHHVTVDHSKESVDNDGKVASAPMEKYLKGSLGSLRNMKFTSSEVGEPVHVDKEHSDLKIVEATVAHIVDVVCCKETDEEVSDVQNSADLLPPELKDAIFEDLPHDLLDGISMQDIFQDKFLNFEELGKDDQQDDPSVHVSGRCESSSEKQKRARNLHTARELKRSKSDVLPSHPASTDSGLHQRSCSLAWSCKLGANISCRKTSRLPTTDVSIDRTKLIQELRLSVKPASSADLQQLRLSVKPASSADIRYCLQGPGDKGKENQSLSWPRILQVDGASDLTFSSSDEGSDLEVVGLCSVANNAQTFQNLKSSTKLLSNFKKDSELLCGRIECLKTVTSAALLKNTIPYINAQSANHVMRKSKRKRPNKRNNPGRFTIPQLDGANDASSDSEHDGTSDAPYQEQADEKPVRCDRCGCTYRTEGSYTRHLPSCSGDYSLTTSESEAEISEEDSVDAKKSVSTPSPDSAISVSSGSLAAFPIVSPTAQHHAFTSTSQVEVENASLLNTLSSQSGNQSNALFNNATFSADTQTLLTPSNQMVNSVTTTVSKVQKMSTANKSKATRVSSQQQTMKLMVKGNQSMVQHQQLFQQNNHQQQMTPISVQQPLPTSVPQQSHQTSQMIMLDYQQSQQPGPTVLVQSVPSPAMVPAYLEAFQQHTGQNLQYLATVDGGYGKTQYVAAVPSAVVPGAYQLQAMPDGQLCLEPSTVNLSTLSGIQLAPAQLAPAQIAQVQPQVLGTLIQSPLPCGVVATTEPVYETIQMYPDQSGGVLLASQPMLTCMETVVSNTYMSMSSSQFVSSSVPGMLQGSSTFSTTTTQVFQASKVDPPVLDVPTQYVVVNTQPSLPESTVGKLEVMSISQPQIQEQAPIQTQAQIQLPSINLPVPVTMTAPLPPQTLPPLIPPSVVTPMPRVQPQRTYSKPSKLTKENIAIASKLPGIRASVKESIKALPSRAICKTVTAIPSLSGTKIYPIENEMKNVPNASALKPATEQEGVGEKFSSSSDTSMDYSSSSAELITTNIAPAQSITLPDPVKSSAPVAGSMKTSKGLPGSICAAPIKCTPFLTSLRPQEKNNLKLSKATVPVESNTHSSVIGKVDAVTMTIKSEKGVKNHAQKIVPSAQPHLIITLPSSKLPSISPDSSVVSKSSAPQGISSTIKLPPDSSSNSSGLISTSAASESHQSHPLKRLTDLESNGKLETSKSASTFVSSVETSVTEVKENNNLAVPKLSILTAPSPITSSMTKSNPASPVMVGPIGPKDSARLVCDLPINDSMALTEVSSPSTLVSAIKSSNASVVELKPLKEINHANLNSDAKTVTAKLSEKCVAIVPPTVLKSTSQNVGISKRNEVFPAEAEIPMLFQNKDNSPTSLKLLFQKQAHNGCYKVSSSPGKKDGELVGVKLADIRILNSGAKDKNGGKDESENVEPVEKTSKKNQSSAPEIIYEIHCQDGFSYSSTSICDAWQKVFGAVQEARASHKMPPLLHNPFNSVESAHNVMGLSNNSLKYLLEQLPGVGNFSKYRPVYHKSRLPGSGYQFKREDQDLVSRESHSGCARTDPYLSAKKYDMFSWLDSRHRRPPKLLENNDIDSLTGSRRAAITSLPMAMRFRHLRETSKTSVGVFRSDIHGRGLFCLRDIEAGEMVIEYAGEVIRNTLTDNREKYYQSKGIGCYMFKVDDNFTVDATQKGNAARFINHSCEPNCYSRVVDILGKKHIIIFAFRRIPQGEELTYDYKFPIEDEKIHCHCLARRCRKYLN